MAVKKSKRRRGRRPVVNRVVVVEPSKHIGARIVDLLISSGYAASSTTSIDVAAALVRTQSIDVVLINLSEYSSACLSRLAQALESRCDVHLVATLSIVSARRRRRSRVGEVSEGPATPSSSWREGTFCVRFWSPRQLNQGLNNRPLN